MPPTPSDGSKHPSSSFLARRKSMVSRYHSVTQVIFSEAAVPRTWGAPAFPLWPPLNEVINGSLLRITSVARFPGASPSAAVWLCRLRNQCTKVPWRGELEGTARAGGRGLPAAHFSPSLVPKLRFGTRVTEALFAADNCLGSDAPWRRRSGASGTARCEAGASQREKALARCQCYALTSARAASSPGRRPGGCAPWRHPRGPGSRTSRR